MYSLATGEYVVVFELNFASSIDISTVKISATSSIEIFKNIN